MSFKRVAAALALLVALTAAPFADAAPVHVVGLGDSLMAGYGLAPGQSFPEKLQAALRADGHDVVIANAGVSGDTTADGLSRLDWSVPDGTDMVILELGANDMLRGVAPQINAEEPADDHVAAEGRAASTCFWPACTPRRTSARPMRARSTRSIRTSPIRYGLTLYPFFLDGVATHGALLLSDGMHPNADGRRRDGQALFAGDGTGAREAGEQMNRRG